MFIECSVPDTVVGAGNTAAKGTERTSDLRNVGQQRKPMSQPGNEAFQTGSANRVVFPRKIKRGKE